MHKFFLSIILCLTITSLYSQNRMFSSQNSQKNVIPVNVSNSVAIENIVYSQSSVYSSNTAATNSKMTDGVFAETSQTGTNNTSVEWIKMDLGAITNVNSVVIGCDFNNVLPGGWGKVYTENKFVEYSTDNTNWARVFNTGTFNEGIKTFNFTFNARYIRIVHSGWLCVTEFYATAN